MKKLLLASAALMALSFGGSAVQAADMPVKAAPIPVFSWSGCYVGVQVGYKWGKDRFNYPGTANGAPFALGPVVAGVELTPNFNVNGALGGGEAGCQYQWGSWVWGVEVDGSWVAASGQAGPLPSLIPSIPATVLFTTQERYLATARGRLGYAWDKWLWYVTGGGAWAGIDVRGYNSALPGFSAGQRLDRGGWVVGYGTEYALGHGWSVKGESLYVDFGTYRTSGLTCAPGATCLDLEGRLHQWIWRFGMNYKFDWYTPVVAKY